jgi:hypothetical protein
MHQRFGPRKLFVSEYDKLYPDDEPLETEPKEFMTLDPAASEDQEAKERQKAAKKKAKSVFEKKWFLHHKYKFPPVGFEKEEECTNIVKIDPANSITLSYFQQANVSRQTD